jgi:hypothetical protein
LSIVVTCRISRMPGRSAGTRNIVAPLGGPGRPDGFLERRVRLWWRQWNGVKSPGSPFRIDNTLVDSADISKVLAVVD